MRQEFGGTMHTNTFRDCLTRRRSGRSMRKCIERPRADATGEILWRAGGQGQLLRRIRLRHFGKFARVRGGVDRKLS